ncbi:MAG TPA: EAL domain-containing protein [Mycobacteriales bacterium]|jgi:diguanylate cyclase (GGDEF)-like protein/PAS domain S-box-containing protein|nr:EAL domain-containing protein [Mycobacteriales bacterium]
MTAAPAQGSPLTDADVRLIAESIPHIIWMATHEGVVEYLNPYGARYLGYPAGWAGEWDWTSATHPEDAAHVMAAWQQGTQTLTEYAVDYRIRRHDGEYRWHACRGLPITQPDGSVLRWVGTATDIDSTKRLEADLQAQGAGDRVLLLETLQSKAPIGFGFVDRDFRIIHVNEMLASIQGVPVAEQLGRHLPLVIPQMWQELGPLYTHVLETGQQILNLETSSPSASDPSQLRHWSSSLYPITVDDDVIGVGVVIVDVTERKAADEVRRQLAAIVEGSGDPIFSVTLDGAVTSWNRAAEQVFGWAAEEVIGQSIEFIAPGEMGAEQRAMRARLVAGSPPQRLETVRRRKDGSLVDVLITASTATDDFGHAFGLSVVAHDITERRTTERALEASRRGLAEAQHIAQLGSFEFDVVADATVWSDELHRMLGHDPAQPASTSFFLEKVDPEDRPALTEAWTEALAHGTAFDLVFRINRVDEEWRWVHARVVTEIDAGGRVVKLSGTVRDNTERVQAEEVRAAAETRFEIGFEQSAIGAAIGDLDGLPVRVNPALCALLQRSKEELIGRRWSEFTHPDEPPLGEMVLSRVDAGYDTYQDERRYIAPDGSVVWASSHVTLVRDEDGEPQYFFVQLQDISERKRMEDELSHQALHDTLTGLPNRALLRDRLLQGLASSRRRGSVLGVIFVDIDHFKVINDSLGHLSGDDLLRHAADRIQGAIRPEDTVARFGGDEFVIACDSDSVTATVLLAEQVLEALAERVVIGGQEMNVSASVGIAVADENASPESLLRDSDAAMHRAKDRGRGRIELYDEALRAKAERRLVTASALGHALERNQFAVHYQPIVDLTTGAIVSAEALLRWTHPKHGPISPVEFIPVAEETNLIIEIGAWVLEQACLELAEWGRFQPSMSVAVNLSVRQMVAPDIAGLISGVIRRTAVDPTKLCLELTESVFMEDVDFFARTLDGLKALGVRLAIDDFGTGYSSLNYLKRFPVDAVKVDRGFVDGLGSDPHDSALVAAIVAMADALDLEVTAEGVETHDQLVSLKRLNCGRAQGFYLARPMPAADLRTLVEAGHIWSVD